jgi:hypothetical protein
MQPSALPGVYLEHVLKSSDTCASSIWMRNIPMAFWTPIQRAPSLPFLSYPLPPLRCLP